MKLEHIGKMYFEVATTFVLISILIITHANTEVSVTKQNKMESLGEHALVSDSGTFPYVVAVLKKSTYMSAGALIDDSWVITAADSLFLLQDSSRIIRVRLGSINHKKGGILLPIKYFRIHPYFDDNKPQYDIALVKLPQPVRFTSNLYPVRLQSTPRKVSATHFIVTGWQTPAKKSSIEDVHHEESLESIRRRRLLSVYHLHPTYEEECSEQLSIAELTDAGTLMSLDPAVGADPCERHAGAPVVLNGILWGVVSSWKPEDCDLDSGPTYVNLVAAGNVSSWIQTTLHDESYKKLVGV